MVHLTVLEVIVHNLHYLLTFQTHDAKLQGKVVVGICLHNIVAIVVYLEIRSTCGSLGTCS